MLQATNVTVLDIINAGFEEPVLPIVGAFTNGYSQGDPIPGWELYDPNGLSTVFPDIGALHPLPAEFPDGIPEGINVGYTFAFTPIGSGVIGLSQTLNATLTTSTRYILQVEVGNIADGNPNDAVDLDGFPGYRVELLAGGTVLAADDNTLAIAEGEFKTSTVTFIAPNDAPNLGSALEIRLLNLIQGAGLEVDFDDVRLIAETVSVLGSGATGQKTFTIDQGDGIVVIDQFGGIGTGTNPTDEAIAELDLLQLQGEGLTARNMLLTQVGNDLEITFDGTANTKIVLTKFALENLDNPPKIRGNSLGNIRFDGQTSVTDSFDVVDANWHGTQLFNRNSVTFLNAGHNTVSGFNGSNDVINGQEGNDTLSGLGGDDYLRGGKGNDQLMGGNGNDVLVGDAGKDWLDGGKGDDTLTGGAGSDHFVLAKNSGNDVITDFESGIDRLYLSNNLSFEQLTITQGTGDQSNHSIVTETKTGKTIATLIGIQANMISIADFVS
jgi:Ca2+-binding RTX toxin-like protein